MIFSFLILEYVEYINCNNSKLGSSSNFKAEIQLSN